LGIFKSWNKIKMMEGKKKKKRKEERIVITSTLHNGFNDHSHKNSLIQNFQSVEISKQEKRARARVRKRKREEDKEKERKKERY
jgi:hypothetical protein